jgi:hypothetical protein
MPGHDEQGLRLQRYAACADFFSCAAAIFRSSTKRWYSRQAQAAAGFFAQDFKTAAGLARR